MLVSRTLAFWGPMMAQSNTRGWIPLAKGSNCAYTQRGVALAITFRVCLITIWEGMGGWCFGGNPMVECKIKCDSQLQYIPIATDFAQLHAAGWRQN